MPLRCLIVDDSPSFPAAARGLLERQGIVVIGTASTGLEAMRQVRQLRPDVVLVDIELDGESGFDVTRRLHEDADCQASPVIIVSTHAAEDYAELVADTPAVGFLPKISLSASAIHDLLRRRGEEPANVLTGPPES